jgi:hypothetical protein
LATVATAHDHKLADGTGFDGLDHLVGKGKNLVVAETTDDAAVFDGARGLAGEGHFDDFGEIFMTIGVGHDVFPTGIAGGIGGEHAILVGGVGEGRHDAVGGEENGAIEGGELFALLPPSVAVVADEVLVLLECRVIVGGKHLAVGVNIDAFAFGLFEQHFEVLEIVAADEDAGTAAAFNRHFGHFGVPVGAGVGGVKLSHRLHTVLAGAEREGDEAFDIELVDGEGGHGVAHEAVEIEIFVAETLGVFHVGSHALEAVDDEFGERTLVGVGFGQNAYFSGFGVVGFAAGAPGHGIGCGHGGEGTEAFGQGIAEVETAINACGNAFVVEIGVGDGAEQGIGVEVIDFGGDVLAVAAKFAFEHGDAAHHKEEQVLKTGGGGFLAANAFDEATGVACRFLALEAEHFRIHCYVSVSMFEVSEKGSEAYVAIFQTYGEGEEDLVFEMDVLVQGVHEGGHFAHEFAIVGIGVGVDRKIVGELGDAGVALNFTLVVVFHDADGVGDAATVHLFEVAIFAIGFEEFEDEGEEHIFFLHEVHVKIDERLLEEGAGFGELELFGTRLDGAAETGEDAGTVVADAAVMDLEDIVDKEIGGPVFGQCVERICVHLFGILAQR